MSDDAPTRQVAPTRRDTIKYGTALVGSGLVAGCVGNDSTGTPDETPDTDDGHSVSMEPVGTVEFESVPEQWLAYTGDYADMGVALGQADGLEAIGVRARFGTHYYEELPGVAVDDEALTQLWNDGTDKEVFYELDPDVNVVDPNFMVNRLGLSEADVEEIRDNVAPFVGNMIFRRSDSWHDYRYYTLYQAFERIATLFQQRDRYEAFSDLHEEYIADIQSRLPPASDRPSVMLTYEGTDEPETFSPYRLTDQGTSKKQWNDLGVSDALAGTGIENLSTENRDELDYENLLEVDPDVLLVRGHEDKSASEFRETVLAYMQEHSVGSELTAVQNERVYRGGYLRQGPIQNLFLTERAAQQLFPGEFGEVTGDQQLFDRQRVADIVNGGGENE